MVQPISSPVLNDIIILNDVCDRVRKSKSSEPASFKRIISNFFASIRDAFKTNRTLDNRDYKIYSQVLTNEVNSLCDLAVDHFPPNEN